MESKPLKSVKGKAGNKKKGILLIVLATLCTAVGLTMLKIGINRYAYTFFSLFNVHFLAGIILYGLSAMLLILGLKEGNLSTLYPIISLSYIWVIVISVFALNEPLEFVKVLGSAAIILGVAVIGLKGDLKKRSEKNRGKENV